MNRLSGLIFTFVLSSTFSLNCYSWGAKGHRVVGEIAEQYLTSKAKQEIKKILEGDGLAEASTWADDIRSDSSEEYRKFIPWHYTTILDPETYQTSIKGDILKSLSDLEAILISSDKSKLEKAKALKLYVHFMGDLHQPLHVGWRNDRGGNMCKVLFHGKQVSLHSLWDSGMIEREGLSFTELSRFIGKVESSIYNEWLKGNYFSWALESRSLGLKIYPAPVKGKKPFSYCSKKVRKSLMPKLGYKYSYQFVEKLKDRLNRGGVRLAGKLNKIFQ